MGEGESNAGILSQVVFRAALRGAELVSTAADERGTFYRVLYDIHQSPRFFNPFGFNSPCEMVESFRFWKVVGQTLMETERICC